MFPKSQLPRSFLSSLIESVFKPKFPDSNIFAEENEQHSGERGADAAVGGGDGEQVQLHDGRAQRPQVIRCKGDISKQT